MLGGIMTPTHTTCGIMTAVLASATLSACSSTSADEQQNSQSQPAHQAAAVSSEPTTTDIAEEDARPSFPELGPFDPNLRGEDMPDPCTWATPEIMAELGYPVFSGSETLLELRNCYYSGGAETAASGLSVAVSFNSKPVSMPKERLGDEDEREIFYQARSEFFDSTSFASVSTEAGAFEIGLTNFASEPEENDKEALRILEALLREVGHAY